MRNWLVEISDGEQDKLIEKIADGVVKRGMDTPAIFFLEMHKPLTFFASQGLIVLSPFVGPFVGIENVRIVSKLLEKRENVERLIQRIEELAEARRNKRSDGVTE